MDDTPLAYHVTFGTYGTRLHGDPRGTVDRSMNQPGDPIIGGDPERWIRESTAMRFPPVLLTLDQRRFGEATIPEVCTKGGWTHVISSAGEDHVHVLLSTGADGAAVRRWLKRWLGERLSSRWPLAPEQGWWAEGGSVKWVWNEDYLENVYEYIRKQRATP